MLLLLAFLLAGMPGHGQARPTLDSLERALEKETIPIEKCTQYNQLARAYIGTDLQKSDLYVRTGIQLAKDHQLREQLGNLYCTAGVVQISLGNNQPAFAYTDSALTIYREIGSKKGVGSALGNMGAFYYYLGEFDKSLAHQYQSLAINEELNDPKGIATVLSNILGIQYVQQDYESALKTGYRGYKLFYEIGDKEGQSDMAFNIATVYLEKEMLDSAIRYTDENIRLSRQLQSKDALANGLRQLANIEIRQKKYDMATDHVHEAMALYEAVGSRFKQVELLDYLVNIYYSTGRYQQSIEVCNHFLEQSREIGARHFERDALLWLVKNYEALKDYERAFYYSQLYIPVKDSVLNETNMQQLAELETKYETVKKERENDSLRQQGEIQSLELSRRGYFIYALAGVLLLVIALSALFIRQNRILTRQRTVELEQRLLRSQMNPHFIFNALIAIQSYVYKNEPRESGKFISSFARLMRGILENSKKEYIPLSKEIRWLENYLELQLLRFENKFEYIIEVSDDADPEIILIPPMLTQPFIENALEHGLRDIAYKGMVHVAFRIEDNTLKVSVQDNGIGMPADVEKQSSDKGSMAMDITRERLWLLNRGRNEKISFEIAGVQPSGTMVTFYIPL